MHSPLIAAALAAAPFLAAPTAGKSLANALDISNIFQPLTCAMAHSGGCDTTATGADADATNSGQVSG